MLITSLTLCRTPLGLSRAGLLRARHGPRAAVVQGPRPRREHLHARLVFTARFTPTLTPLASRVWHAQFRILAPDEVPASQGCGVGFKTVSVYPAQYLPWLKAELVAHDVAFVRKTVTSLGEAAALTGPGGVLVNATGLGALYAPLVRTSGELTLSSLHRRAVAHRAGGPGCVPDPRADDRDRQSGR